MANNTHHFFGKIAFEVCITYKEEDGNLTKEDPADITDTVIPMNMTKNACTL